MVPTMERLALFLAVGGILLQLCYGQQEAFLQKQLPLRVLVTTPSELSSDAAEAQAVTLTGRQAITAVFNRPVIALGSDWGSEQLPANLVPFTLSCGTPGRLRWVTTNIARFDPSIDWPTDLDCQFEWNKALKTYDGAPLQLEGLQPSVRLQTQPITMSIQQVQSEAAMAATGGQWSASLGAPDDRLPEVPPDGNITLTFSYPVELAQLAKSLKLTGASAGADSRTLTVSPCPMVTRLPVPLIFTAYGAVEAEGKSRADLLAMNSTCAVVKIVPGLAAGAAAALLLPKGARYSPVAGPASQDISVDVYGLRPFRIPLRWDFQNKTEAAEQVFNGVTYRRLTLWLPHGLAKDASLADVKAAISICCLANPSGSLDSSCSNQPYDLTRPAPAVLSMRVPALNPGQRCIVRVKADPKIKDAFGLPLQASSNAWWSVDLDAAFVGPSVRQVALLEPAPANSTLQWPWVSRGTPEPGVNRVQAVSVPVGGASSSSKDGGLLERAIAAVLAGYSGGSSSILSTASAKVQRKDATWPTFQSLSLPGQPGISLIGTCCRQVSYPSPREALATSALVIQSDLQAAFIEQNGQLVTWVTTTQGQSKAKEGARVQVYGSTYGKDAATAGPACITASDGTCVIDLAAAKSQKTAPNAAGASAYQPFEDGASYTAVITAEGHGPLVVPNVPNSARYRSSSSTGKEYVATLVLDRKLVKPGDDLHVTGYVQRKEGSQLKVDQALTSLVLQVSPGFDRPAPGSSGGGSRGNPLRVPVTVDPTYGTLHAVIPVPKDATPATYNLQLWTPTPVDGAGNAPIGAAEGPNAVSAGPVSVVIGGAGPRAIPGVQPSTMEALSSAAAANVKAAGRPVASSSSSSSGRRLHSRAAGPTIAVMPKPKQLMGMGMPSDPGTNPPGVPFAAPAGLREPNFELDPVATGGDAGQRVEPAEDCTSSSRRQLQQAVAGQDADTPSAEPLVVEDDPVEQPEVVEVPGNAGAAGMTAPVLVEPSIAPNSQPAVSAGASPGFAAALPGPVPMPRPSGATLPLLGVNLAYTTFAVGDPRPPTATLGLESEAAWVKPDGSVGVSVAAKSYVGSDVSGAEVTLKWSTGKAEGEMVLKTNATGVATGTVDLGKLAAANRSEAGDTLTLKATWIGPTREPLMQSKTIKIVNGPVRVELQRTLHTNVPGVAFGVSAEAFSNQDDSPVKGATVEVTLTPRNASTSLANCTAAQKASLAQQKCSITAGDTTAATSCQLTLPCTGEFVLKGCIKGGSNSGCSKDLNLGRNMTAWMASPWSSGPGQVQLLPDRKNISLGQDVALTMQNPYWGPVSALVVWGNGVQREHFFLDQIPPGPSTIVIQELGQECRGGCSVVVTLAVARPKAGSAAPAGNTSRSAPSPAAAAPAANQTQRPTQTPASPRPNASQPARPMPAASPAVSNPRGTGFRAPPAPAAAAQGTPRGLVGSGPSSNSGGVIGTQQRPSNYGAGQADGLSSSGNVRTYTGLWPFTVNVHGLPPRRQRARVNLFGSNGSNGRGLRRVSGTRNERGSALSSAPGSSSIAALPDIPRSKLYDPYAPITVSAQVDLTVPDTESLSVDVTVSGQSKDAAGVAALAPQSKQGSISVSVKDGKGAAVANAEVTLLVVDKAVLDLMPYELQDVSAAMQPKLRAAFSLLHLNALRVTRAAINATFSTLQRRLVSIDPWLPVDTQVSPSEGVSPMEAEGDLTWLPPSPAVDIPDDVYLRGYSTALTPMPYKPCPLGELNCPTPMVAGHSHGSMAMASMAAPVSATMVAADAAEGMPAPPMPGLTRAMAKSAGANGENASAPMGGNAAGAAAGAGAAGAQLRLQQAFKVTPLFKTVTTGADGKVKVDFTAPDNLGRFVVRAYVAAPKAAVKTASDSNSGVVYGGVESAVIVRRTVSLVPSLPRQVRVSDNFTAGVLVEAPGTVTDVTVTVTATLQQPSSSKANSSGSSSVLSISKDKSRTVTLSPGKPQQEVRFDFTADVIGEQKITFAATAGGAAGANRGANRGLKGAQEGGEGASGPFSLLSAALRGMKQALPAIRREALPSASAGAVADQVQLQVPVNGKQGGVVIATSFAVRGSRDGNSWQEGMVLPRAEQGSGSISLVAGVGSLPAIQAAFTGLAEQGLDPRCTPASQAVALSLLPAFLALYQKPGTSVASLLSAKQLQLTEAAFTAVTTKLTHQKYGLLPVEQACLYSGSQGVERADVTLNAWAVWMTKQALSTDGNSSGKDGGSSSTSGSVSGSAGVLASGWSSIQSSAKGWVKALETQLVADAVSACTGSRYSAPAAYSDLETLAWARLVLGSAWSPKIPASGGADGTADGTAAGAKNISADVKRDLSMERLTTAALAGNLTVGGQARVGLALLRFPEGASVGNAGGKVLKASDAVQRISKRLVSSIRVGGRTAYVATVEGARSAAGLSDQSMALTFLTDSSDAATDNPLIQKLAAWVAQGAAPPPLFFAAVCVSSSPWDAALRSQALTTYDSSTASLTPDLQLSVNAQPKPTPTSKRAPVPLLSASFTAQTAGKLASSSKWWEAVPANSTLVFAAKGTGEVSVAAALDFTPADLLPFPTYRGLWVQRAVLVDQGAGGSGGLKAAEGGVGLGKIVTLAVQVTSPDDQSDVVVEALMPGGLEPMDPNIFKDADAATICSSGNDETPLSGSSGGMNDVSVGFSPKPRFLSILPMPMPFSGGGDSSGSFWRPMWPVCPLQTTSPDRVTFRFSYLRAGTHTMRFRAVAATSGVFVLPPVKAFVQQQPEVMGLSPAGVLTVCASAEACAAAGAGGSAAQAAGAPAKACPADCNGNGACNLSTGTCLCDSGFGGAACADLATE